MSAGQSQRSVALSTRSRQEAELAALEKRERAAAETAAATVRASRLAAAREEAEAAADAARAAATEVEVLRGSVSSSISADNSVDVDLDLLAREAVREQAVRWAAVHTHERSGSPDRSGRAINAPGGCAHGGGAPREGARDNGGRRVDGERGHHRRRDSLSSDSTVVTTGSRLLSGTLALTVGGLLSPRSTTLSGPR